MLLDRIDIDAHGPLNRVELGPFAEHLNVVWGAEHSGKTAIARFVRDSLCNRRYPLGMLSSSTGRVVWATPDGLVHCRREKDGTNEGRRTIEFESRGDSRLRYTSLENSWVNGINSSSDSSRAHRSIQIPESIVDCVVTDTAVIDVARVVSACVRAGLDNPAIYQGLPLSERYAQGHSDDFASESSYELRHTSSRHLAARAELADVEAELSSLGISGEEHAALVARREAILAQLNRAPQYSTYRVAPVHTHDYDAGRHDSLRGRLFELNERADRLRAREQQLRHWITDIESESAYLAVPTHAAHAYDDRRTYSHSSESSLPIAVRRQLDDFNAQLIRLRRALSEVRGLRSLMMVHRDEQVYACPIDDVAWRKRRLSGFAHAIDRYDYRSGWDRFYGDAYKPLGAIDDVDVRVGAAVSQIDWLLERYNHPLAGGDWYASLPPTMYYGDATTIADTLRAIRSELDHVRLEQRRTYSPPANNQTHGRWTELQQSENWLISAIDHLVRYRNAILDGAAGTRIASEPNRNTWVSPNWQAERAERIDDLRRTRCELDACLSEAADVRRQMRYLPVIDSRYVESRFNSWPDRDALSAELRQIEHRLTSSNRTAWLQRRRAELLDILRVVRRPSRSTSPLADQASRWLVRLSAGRLNRIDWQGANSRQDSRESTVRINGRPEGQCAATDRALASLAVRMAAGDLLARTGRGVPLIIETSAAMTYETSHDSYADERYDGTAWALREHSLDGRSNHPLAAALHDYTRAGRQVLLLTGNQSLADEIIRVGGRGFRINAERIVHAHRPVWRSNHSTEHYVGPYPHGAGIETDVNRDLDVAWHEVYGANDYVHHTDRARDGVEHRDGYYYADTYTTDTHVSPKNYDNYGQWVEQAPSRDMPRSAAIASEHSIALTAGRQEAAQRPFFLTVDSPIDQAPSIDAVAAARLRNLNITHITHLMRQDSNRLADSLGLTNVDAATIRRWQSECRLVCRVPQLRGFDARILVGCGITDPAQLAAIPPNDLLVRVQTFLATERGQQILLSGTSYELSRITRWIASANRSVSDSVGGVVVDGKRVSARLVRDADDFDTDRYEYDGELASERSNGTRRRRVIRTHHADGRVTVSSDDTTKEPVRVVSSTTRNSDLEREASGYTGARVYDGNSTTHSRKSAASRSASQDTLSPGSTSGTSRSSSGSSRRSSFGDSSHGDSDRRSKRRKERTSSERAPGEHKTFEYAERESRKFVQRDVEESSSALRFYLHRESPIVDAPSIGPRMAEKLMTMGLHTVDDLLQADPASVAEQLEHRRIDEAVVRSWQQQSTLVCRVPMLRGHDAQILVAAGITEPERLAECDPDWLLSQVDPISHSREGKRILRGGTIPDLAEINEWITCAAHHRELIAA